jgi:hypothetical protein
MNGWTIIKKKPEVTEGLPLNHPSFKKPSFTVTAVVSHRKGIINKVRIVSDVKINVAGFGTIATLTMGGKATEKDALREFKRFPNRFTPINAHTAETLLAFARAA